jgi:glycosyltransferase involved in cell wall biosynthesis
MKISFKPHEDRRLGFRAVPARSPGADERRIAFAYELFYPYTVGGAERYYRTLATALNRSWSVSYLTRRHWKEGAHVRVEEGVEVHGLTPGRGRIRYVLALFAHLLARGGRYEVVHCCCFPHVGVVAAWAALLPHRRTALVVDWYEVFTRETWRGRRGRLGDLGYLVQRLAIRCTSAAVSLSRMHERRLRAQGCRGRIVVLPGFLPEEPRPAAGRGERRNLVVFLARLVPEKRPELVPAVVAVLRRADPTWEGVIFGGGECEPRVRAAIAETGTGETVRLAGVVPWEEVSAALCEARALLFPSAREGFGLAVLEAAAHGVPSVLVAGTDNAATEVVEQGRNGVVCEAPDPDELARAVLELAATPDIHRRVQAWYQESRRRLSVDNAVSLLEGLHATLRD